MWKQLFLATSAAAQAFNISVWDSSDGLNIMRVWYGDGIAYAGAVVPPEVSVAFNVTSPGLSGPAALSLNADGPVPSSSPVFDSLSFPVYLAVNSSSGAEDPIFFVSNPSDVESGTTIATWAAYEGVLFPMNGGSSIAGIPYLGPTSVEGTWVVRWNVGGKQSNLSQKLATIMSRAPSGGWGKRDAEEEFAEREMAGELRERGTETVKRAADGSWWRFW